ncbi:MAG: hypothetical protein ACETWR_09515 [Anaerolineae bacterium]
MNINVDWEAVGAISTGLGSCCGVLSIVLLIVSLWYVRREIREMRIATYASTYQAAREILQKEDVRAARRLVFNELSAKPFDTWSEQERLEAEKVCQSYDSVGQMVRNGFLPKDYIVDNWGGSLRNSWPILSPLVHSYRAQSGFAKGWDDYEWLATQSMASE